jgi:signal transduction histidine kinase/CheY-like chemotaxis protein
MQARAFLCMVHVGAPNDRYTERFMFWRTWCRGLRWRLVLLISLALTPAIVFMVIHGIERRDRHLNELRAQTMNLARLAAQEQARRLEGARQLLIALGNSFRVENLSDCVRDVRALLNEYRGLYSELGWADRAGRVRCHALPGDNLSIAERQYFRDALSTDRFVVGELIIGKISRVPVLAFSHPLRDSTGTVIGVLFANIDLRVLSQSLEGPARESGGVISILDRHGALVARSHDASQHFGAVTDEAQLRALRRQGELIRTAQGADGRTRQNATVTVRDADGEPALFVRFEREESPLLAATAARFRDDLVTIALLALGMIAAALIGAELLVRRPVNRLLEATTALGTGKLNTRADALGTTAEFVALAEGFNRMASQLEQRDLHLREGQRLEAIGQMAGGIAHDFNNLLTIIIGYSATLEEQVPAASEAARELAELRAAADKAAALTQQLLIFSRRQTLQRQRFVINDVISGMETILRRTIGGDIQLGVTLDAQAGMVCADPTQIEQVLLNLVINARDAMPSGGTIAITSHALNLTGDNFYRLPPGSYTRIEVADNGIGMDAATRARVFEPFFSTKGPRGTGLGLATVYGIITQSGGTVRCDSAPGLGSRFEFLLPRVAGSLDAATATPPSILARGHERVLVVDDEPTMRTLISSTLSRRGYDVWCAEDGVKALEILRQTSDISLVISDVRMPRMNGLALLAELRQHHPHLPTLLISGASAPEVTADDRQAPLFLQKPFTPTALLTATRTALAHQT